MTKRVSITQQILQEAERRHPSHKREIEKVGAVLESVSSLADHAFPYARRAYQLGGELYVKAQPYNLQDYAPLVLPITICFFGGTYATLIALVETVRLVAWKRLQEVVRILYVNYQRAQEESRKDDLVDADGNGIPDVQEISDRELLSRKFYVFARSVNTQDLYESVAILTGAFFAVIAAMRVSFTHSFALGCSLASIAEKFFSTQQLIEEVLPREFEKWAEIINSGLFKVVGIIVAVILRRCITTLHSSFRGAYSAVQSAIVLAQKHGLVEESFTPDCKKAKVLTIVIGSMGFMWQVANSYTLPFPLNVLLFPVTVVEYLLSALLSVLAADLPMSSLG